MGIFCRIWFGGVSFFCSIGKDDASFINETTARLRCVQVFVKLRSVAYEPICCLPHMAIVCHHERGSKDFFCPHTEAFACGRCAIFIPLTAGVNPFLGIRESGLRDVHTDMRVAHRDAMAARKRSCKYIMQVHAKKTS